MTEEVLPAVNEALEGGTSGDTILEPEDPVLDASAVEEPKETILLKNIKIQVLVFHFQTNRQNVDAQEELSCYLRKPLQGGMHGRQKGHTCPKTSRT